MWDFVGGSIRQLGKTRDSSSVDSLTPLLCSFPTRDTSPVTGASARLCEPPTQYLPYLTTMSPYLPFSQQS